MPHAREDGLKASFAFITQRCHPFFYLPLGGKKEGESVVYIRNGEEHPAMVIEVNTVATCTCTQFQSIVCNLRRCPGGLPPAYGSHSYYPYALLVVVHYLVCFEAILLLSDPRAPPSLLGSTSAVIRNTCMCIYMYIVLNFKVSRRLAGPPR